MTNRTAVAAKPKTKEKTRLMRVPLLFRTIRFARGRAAGRYSCACWTEKSLTCAGERIHLTYRCMPPAPRRP